MSSNSSRAITTAITSTTLSAPNRRRRGTRRTFLRLCGSVLGVGLAVPLEARCIEPYSIETTYHEVYLPGLPHELDGMTIAQMTDLHRGPHTPDGTIRRAIHVTEALKPDAVILTGDFVRWDVSDTPPLAKMLSSLNPRLGVWGCLGNHDYQDSDQLTDILYQEAGVRMLRNENAQIAPGLWIAGIEDTLRGVPDVPEALKGMPKDAPTIFLSHNPTGVLKVAESPYLVLSGHTHGGQILVPGLPPHYPPGMEGFKQIAGWGTYDQAHLYISRGVGMGALPLRFCCRPEVAHFTLRRGDISTREIRRGSSRASDVARLARQAVHAAARRIA